MHLADTYDLTDADQKQLVSDMIDMTMNRIDLSDADKVEVWMTSFKDPGPDSCEARVFKNGKLIRTTTIPGC